VCVCGPVCPDIKRCSLLTTANYRSAFASPLLEIDQTKKKKELEMEEIKKNNRTKVDRDFELKADWLSGTLFDQSKEKLKNKRED
jgi:hypothetical protein